MYALYDVRVFVTLDFKTKMYDHLTTKDDTYKDRRRVGHAAILDSRLY